MPTFLPLTFLTSQLLLTPPLPTTPCTDKTILITGSNTGLGKAAATHFARLGAHTIILAVRSLSKGLAAKADIESTTGCAGDVIVVWELDMARYDSVLAFVEKVERELRGKRLDVVILNAGVVRGLWEWAEDHESTITVNVVSTFLLAVGLMGKLRGVKREFGITPVMTVVGSETHAWTGFEEGKGAGIFEKLKEEKQDLGDRYWVSKLIEVYGVREMAGIIGGNGDVDVDVVVNCVNPGLCHSELGREGTFGLRVMKFFLARTAEVGARTLVHAALAGKESHGMYLSDCKVEEPGENVTSEEGRRVQKVVWEELVGILEGIRPGVIDGLRG